jgi:hypothetical protein
MRWHERRIEHWSRPVRFLAYAGFVGAAVLVVWGIDTLSGDSTLRVPLVLGLVFFCVYVTGDLVRPLLQRRATGPKPRGRRRRLSLRHRRRPAVSRS